MGVETWPFVPYIGMHELRAIFVPLAISWVVGAANRLILGPARTETQDYSLSVYRLVG